MSGGKATAVAPANIAFIKYWGTRDEERTVPFNPSISMTLSDCVSRCTVELAGAGVPVEVLLADGAGRLAPAPPAFAAGVGRHLGRLADWAGYGGSFRVATANSFPTGAGLASSASGFTALALAAAAALGRALRPAELSELARRSGSGSAARSAWGGYVEWPAAAGSDPAEDAGAGGPGAGAAAQLAPAEHWDLRDLVAVVDASPKGVSSRQGHRLAPTSPYFERRLALLPERLERVRRALADRSLARLGPVIEEEAIDLHLIAMSSRPPIHYWRPGTLAVLAEARRLRDEEGVAAWATIDAGPNVHLICEPAAEPVVAARMEALPEVEELIRDRVGTGPRLLEGDGGHLL